MSLLTSTAVLNDICTMTLPVDTTLSDRIISRLWFGLSQQGGAGTMRIAIQNVSGDQSMITFTSTTLGAAGQSTLWEWWEDDHLICPASNITTITCAGISTVSLTPLTGTLYCWYNQVNGKNVRV